MPQSILDLLVGSWLLVCSWQLFFCGSQGFPNDIVAIYRAWLLRFVAVAVGVKYIDPFTVETNSEASIEDYSSNMNEYARLAEHSTADNESALTLPTCCGYLFLKFLKRLPNKLLYIYTFISFSIHHFIRLLSAESAAVLGLRGPLKPDRGAACRTSPAAKLGAPFRSSGPARRQLRRCHLLRRFRYSSFSRSFSLRSAVASSSSSASSRSSGR